MQKRVKWLLNVLLAVVVILSVMPEAAATEHVHDWQCQRADAIFHKMAVVRRTLLLIHWMMLDAALPAGMKSMSIFGRRLSKSMILPTIFAAQNVIQPLLRNTLSEVMENVPLVARPLPIGMSG